MRAHTTWESPMGVLTLVADQERLAGVYVVDQRHRPEEETFGIRDDDALPLAAARSQLQEYFAGERTAFDVPLAPTGTPFQQRVWEALRDIPYAQTCSYGALAAQLGNPKASRAVGLAVGRNPLSIVVPCHRVVGSSGRLVGYGGGLERKAWLLDLEGQHALRAHE